jgi:hypothetical protein
VSIYLMAGIQHVQFEPNPTTVTYYGKKWNQKQVHPCVIDSPNLPRATRVTVTLVARPLLTLVAQNLCICEHGAFTSTTCLHSRISNRTRQTVHRLVTTFRDAGSVCLWQVLIERQNSWN